jgi:hypothetical protein
LKESVKYDSNIIRQYNQFFNQLEKSKKE